MKDPTAEEIRQFAHELYMRHGKTGHVEQYERQAEWELKQMSDRDETGTAAWVRKPSRFVRARGATASSGPHLEFKEE